MVKYKSRASRCVDAMGELESAKDFLQKISDGETSFDYISDPMGKIESAKGEVESLRDEIIEWRDNMSGTNLEHTAKYDELGECADELDEAVSNLEEISDPTDKDELDDIISGLDNVIGTLETVSFPVCFKKGV